VDFFLYLRKVQNSVFITHVVNEFFVNFLKNFYLGIKNLRICPHSLQKKLFKLAAMFEFKTIRAHSPRRPVLPRAAKRLFRQSA